jgi:hypothetical protein
MEKQCKMLHFIEIPLKLVHQAAVQYTILALNLLNHGRKNERDNTRRMRDMRGFVWGQKGRHSVGRFPGFDFPVKNEMHNL